MLCDTEWLFTKKKNCNLAANLNLYCVGDNDAIEILNNFSLFTLFIFNVFQITKRNYMGMGVMGEFKSYYNVVNLYLRLQRGL